MAEMGNRDGFGLMWVEGERTAKGKIKGNTGRIRKVQSMAKPEEIAKIYAEHMDNNIAVHVRNATLGTRRIAIQ
jgi:predicted glutamine amidotransferase